MKIYTRIAILLFLCLCLHLQAQDEWWYEKHGFTDTRNWYYNMTFTPGRMGPFAFDIPQIATPNDTTRFEFTPTYKFAAGNRGDLTHAFNLHTKYRLAPRLELYLHGNLYEHFTADTRTMHYRMAIDTATSGSHFGDMHLGFRYNLLKEHPKLPDVLFEMDWKTSTGNGERQAQHTGAPGYHFALHLSDALWVDRWQWKAMLGFYSYQISHMLWRQNDCVLFGGGLTYQTSKWKLSTDISGFAGYFGSRTSDARNEDVPLLWRSRFELTPGPGLGWMVGLDHGLHHYPFTVLKTGIIFGIP